MYRRSEGTHSPSPADRTLWVPCVREGIRSVPTPRPPRPPYPPAGAAPGARDEDLAARLRGRPGPETAPATALLTARHWRRCHQYAALCLTAPTGTASPTGTVSPADTAALVTSAAFHQVLDRLALGEPATALRPRLLVAVRDTVRVWSAADGIRDVLPGLRGPLDGGGTRALSSPTGEHRRLAERSFQGLPGAARCLLWHTEVEADPVDVPAALLGMDTATATAALDQAREMFREGCLRAHRELAPTQDCRFHNRLLDIPIRRGGTLLPDVHQHLAGCRHCRFAAEQLAHFKSGLGVLLAESVLGWGARGYLESRPPRTPVPPPALPFARRPSSRHAGSRRRVLPRLAPPSGPRRPRPTRAPRALLAGAGLVSAGLVVTLVAAGMWSHDGDADPAASTGTGTAPAGGARSAPGTARLPATPDRSRLRNEAAGLCLDIKGTPERGAGTGLAPCSTAPTQRWTYENDGLLRSEAEPGLCLDAHLDAGVVVLGGCAPAKDARADDVRYDLTVRGELLPRWDERLALAPVTGDAGAAVVVTVRDGSAAQRWFAVPAGRADPGSLTVTGEPGSGAGADVVSRPGPSARPR